MTQIKPRRPSAPEPECVTTLSRFGQDVIYFHQSPVSALSRGRRVPEGMELVELMLDGEVYFRTDGKKHRYGRGWMFWHMAGERSIWNFPDGHPYTCMAFHFIARQPRLTPRVTRWNDLDSLDDFLLNLTNARRQVGSPRELAIFEQLTRAELLKQAAQWGRRKDDSAEYPASLRRAMGRMSLHSGTMPSLEEVAAESGVSASTLFTLFRRYLNETPHRWLLRMKLRHAAMLLSGGILPVKEIARQTGFSGLRTFYRAFENAYHQTPIEFRQHPGPLRNEVRLSPEERDLRQFSGDDSR